MTTERLALRPNARIEGLIDSFGAWLQLAAPVNGAMLLANLLLPLLDSFIADPQLHATVSAHPELPCGLFIDVEVDRLDEVQHLREKIALDNQALVEFSQAVVLADQLLAAQARGYGLGPLRSQLPAALRGCTDLVYDVDHHPQLRFMEGLLYRSHLHRETRQSIDLSLDDGSEPPYLLSTPRLPARGHLQLPLPLRHEGIDELFALRSTPQPFDRICDYLEIDDGKTASRLRQLFAAAASSPPGRSVDSGGRIRYFGHSCLVLQSPDVAIVVDPLISSDTGAQDGRFTYADLPDHLDYCLITNGYPDHLVLESLLRLRHMIGVVAVPRNGGGHRQDPSIKLMLQSFGFTVTEVDDFDELRFSGGEIVATPYLGMHCDLDIRAKSTYWIRIMGRSVFVGADSSGQDASLYGGIRRELGDADLAFIEVGRDGNPLSWHFGHLFGRPIQRNMSMSRSRSGSTAAQALDMVQQLNAGEVFVYATAKQPWLRHVIPATCHPDSICAEHVAEFLRTCNEEGVPAHQLLLSEELQW